MTKPAKPTLADKTKELLKSCLHLTNDDDASKNLHLTNDDDTSKNGDVGGLATKTYDCGGSRSRAPAHSPPLIPPTIPNPAQHIACLPALARHAQSRLPRNDPLLVGEQLNNIANMTLALQGKFAKLAGLWPTIDFAERETLGHLEKDLEKLSEDSTEHLGTLQDLLATNHKHIQVVKQSLEVLSDILNQIQAAKDQKCHQSFCLTAGTRDVSYEGYKRRVEDRVEDTCQWFLEHGDFKQWLERDSGPLLVSADPGCGKSVLAKYLIDHVLPRSPDTSICYFFFKDQDQNTVRQALCALLHQLFVHKPHLRRHATPRYWLDGPGMVTNTAVLWDILKETIRDAQSGSVILVLDALDECLESEFQDLAWNLKQLHQSTRQQSRSKLRSFLTCRPYDTILEQFQHPAGDFPCIRIAGENQSDAIAREVSLVVAHRVDQLALEKGLRDDLKNRLKERLLKFEHRNYLWVCLVLEFLRESGFKKTVKGVDDSIDSLGLPDSTVNQAYEKILNRSHKDHVMV